MEKNCIICGKPFEAKQWNQVLCSSPECRSEYIRRKQKAACERRKLRRMEKEAHEVTCPICGTKFKTMSGIKIYCSQECKRAGALAKRKERKQRRKGVIAETDICVVCGEEFKKKNSRTIRCPECIASGKRIRYEKAYAIHTCKHCGKEFSTKWGNDYCSRACADAEAERHQREERDRKLALRAKYDKDGNVIDYYDTVLDKTLAEKVVGSDYGSYQRAKTLAGIEPIKLTL